MLLTSRPKSPRASAVEACGLAALLAFTLGGCEKLSLTPLSASSKTTCEMRCTASGLLAAATAQPAPRVPDAPSAPERASTAEELRRGSSLFRSYACVLCHGLEGRGDGRMAATLRNRPRDLRDLSAFKQGTSIAAISATIERGIVGSGMPAQAFIPPPERELLARYILSLSEARHLSRGGPK